MINKNEHDNLIYDKNKQKGETTRELWLNYLTSKNITYNQFKLLSDFKQYQIHCDYCCKYNIPHVED
jgi:hypothetical protein